MKISDKRFGMERALYGLESVELERCRFEGEEDGESAMKECGAVVAKDCLFDLRYPLWHNNSVKLEDCELTANCRAALWYTQNAYIKKCAMHGIKAVRECANVRIYDSDIVSPEFGWSTRGLELYDTTAESEYFCLRASEIKAKGLQFKGKYSFQYIQNSTFEKCTFDTKDAFWHCKNVTVKDSVVKGEYLGWYSEGLTFVNCTIIGTQPLCYCKGLKLADCVMRGTDLAFERSEVDAVLLEHIDSIKNPYAGRICVPSVGEIIMDDERAHGEIATGKK